MQLEQKRAGRGVLGLTVMSLVLSAAAGLAACAWLGYLPSTTPPYSQGLALPWLGLMIGLPLLVLIYLQPLVRNRSTSADIYVRRWRNLPVIFGACHLGQVGLAAVVTIAVQDAWARALTELPAVALVHLVATVLVATPFYFGVLNRQGVAASRLGLQHVQVSLHSKLRVFGLLIPLLTGAVLMYYYWWRSELLSAEVVAVWGILGGVALVAAWLGLRGVDHALRPVDTVVRDSGTANPDRLAALQPVSTDEIGRLVWIVAQLGRSLRDQEQRTQAVVDNAAEGIIVTDAEGRIESLNPAAEALFGYGASQLEGYPLAWLLPDLVTDSGAPQIAGQEQESRGLRRSGRALPVSARVSRMRLSGRTLYTCLVADISARKAAEKRLRRAEARYRDLVETAHDLVWSWDNQGRWTYLNQAAQTIYGYAPKDMLGRPVSAFQRPECQEPDAKALDELLAGKELVEHETVHLDRQGRPRHLSFNARPHTDHTGQVIAISGTARDITEQKAYQRQLAYQVVHDPLTGLFNRRYLQQELERVVARAARGSSATAVLYMDVDRFKYVNDTLGHAVGDHLLLECARLLNQHTREGDLIARFGGDEFVVLLYNVDEHSALQVARLLRDLFEAALFLEEKEANCHITVSIGVAVLGAEVGTAEEVLSHADLACSRAKRKGRNQVSLYDPSQQDKAGMAADMGWGAKVREMVRQESIRLAYQPIVAVATGGVYDYEVLLRMLDNQGGLVLPGDFMPAAERLGLTHSVDRWVVNKALTELARLRSSGQPIRFSINLSARAFEDHELLSLIRDSLHQDTLDASAVTFEITETAAIAHMDEAAQFVSAVKEMGCQFALDDFGSGFSSFSYLKYLPVDKLKIDGSYVHQLARSIADQAMVKSMNQVAHALGKVTVAEYVEDGEALELLREYGVDFAQGFYIGAPQENVTGQRFIGLATY